MMKFCKIGLNIVLLCLIQESHAQIKYWVEFLDKGGKSPFEEEWVSRITYQQREMLALPIYQASDIPVSEAYVEAMEAFGVAPLVKSKWLNAVSVRMTPLQLAQVERLPFVKGVTIIAEPELASITSLPDYQYDSTRRVQWGEALAQVEAEAFLERGLTGKGVSVGIIDAGFIGAPKNRYLSGLIKNDQVAAWKDFITPDRPSPYKNQESWLDFHGTQVWQMVGGKNDRTNAYQGIATDATYYLARSEHGSEEYRGEQDLWIEALEWLDSCGVRLVNCSLGYSRGFDDPSENYRPHEMDGRSVIAQGVKVAVEEKGMIVVISAGNDGNDITWQYVSTPGEVAEVISVGATNLRHWTKAGYSGVGPPFLDFVKPDVSVFASSGTSFAAPVVTGIIAAMLQADSTLMPSEVQRRLQASSHLASVPNNYLGYGVPNSYLLLEQLALPIDSLPAPPPCSEIPNPDTITALEVSLQEVGIDTTQDLIRYQLKDDYRTVYREDAFAPDEYENIHSLFQPHKSVMYTVLIQPSGYCARITWPYEEMETQQEE